MFILSTNTYYISNSYQSVFFARGDDGKFWPSLVITSEDTNILPANKKICEENA